jgi:hypothetical protein
MRINAAGVLDAHFMGYGTLRYGTPQAAIGDRQTQKIALSGAIFCVYEDFIVILQGNYKTYTYEKNITLSLCWIGM